MKTPSLGLGVDIDVSQLIRSRLLVQANSGGGKSYALRRICEQTFGTCQHIVIDPEGEFYTLREKYDYTLLGKGGDGPADLKSAALLARRLLELGVSAIVDISELGARRQRFVKLFLDALVDSPRSLWHPVIVVVDEAHMFCPEKGRGESESTTSVIDLMTRGRKRGFCGVLATQRVSKLNKDAAAECKNKLVGGCTLDVDRKRAAEELGLSDKADILALRDLEPGEFHAFGPALSKTITKVRVGKVQTTHPEAGEAAPPITPPRAKVKRVLEQLANLPQEVEEETKTMTELQQEVRQLKADLRKAETSQKTETVKQAVLLLTPKMLARVERLAERLTKDTERLDGMRDRLAQSQQAIVSEVGNLTTEVRMTVKKVEATYTSNTLPPRLQADAVKMHMQHRPKIGAPPAIGAQKHPPMGSGRLQVNTEGLGKGEIAVLSALIQYPSGLTGRQLSVITGYVQQSRDTYVSKLVTRGLVQRDQPGHVIALQPAASTALPHVDPLPRGTELQDYWLRKLSKGEAAIFRVVVDAYPEAVQGAAITEATGYVQQSRDTYISKMVGKEIVERVRPGWLRASDTLFE